MNITTHCSKLSATFYNNINILESLITIVW